MHVGEVTIPPPTKEQLEEMIKQRNVVAGLSDRNEMYIKVHNAKAACRQTQFSISQKEDKISSLLQEVQLYRDVQPFDWSLEKNNTVRELKRQIAAHKLELEHENEVVKNLLDEAKLKYPDLEFEVTFRFS